ncbi:MAG: hypothetical protein ACYC5O_04305 [Anaerolineae bacterium]
MVGASAPASGTQAGATGRWHGVRPWLALALLVALPFLFYWRLFTPDAADRGSFAAGDFSGQHYAPAVYLAQRLAGGSLPLWSPGSYGGFPFLADIQNAVLYPPRLLTVLIAAPWGFPYVALELEAVLHFSLAAAFTFFLGRRLFGHDGAAFLAAIVFTFGGYLTSYPSQQLAILESAVWLPLALLCADHAVAEGRIAGKWSFALGGVLALPILAGHPQIAMYVYYVVAVFTLWRRPRRADGRLSWRPAAILALGVALAVGLAAAQVLPTVEYSRLSVRANLGYDAVSAGLPLQETIQVLLPGIVSGYSPLYIGILPLVLAAAVLALRPSRAVRFWLAVAVVAFLLALGNQVFLHRLFYLIAPGWRLFRDQERLAFVVAFAASMLVGYGARMLLTARASCHAALSGEEGRRLLRGIGRFLWLLVVLVLVSFVGLLAQGWTGDSRFYWVLAISIYVLIVAFLAWALLRWWLQQAGPPVLFLCLAAALVLFDLFSVGWRHGFSADPPQTREAMPPAVAAVLADGAAAGPYRVFNEWRLPGNYGVQFGLEDVWGASPLRLARYEELVGSLARERLWALLDVRYVLTWESSLAVPSTVIAALPVDGGDTTYVHRLAQPGAYAWLVHETERVAPGQAPAALAAADFDPATTAVIETGLPEPLAPPAGPEAVTVVERTSERIVLDVDTTGRALLVLSEVDYPGWRASIDGSPVDILVADHVLRALPVPVGEHVVTMEYRPLTWTVGAVVSSASLVVLIAGFALAVRRDRRAPERG